MLKPNEELERYFQELEQLALVSSKNGNVSNFAARSVDVRYAGQGYELNIPAGPDFVQNFHRSHRKRYGYADERKPIEVVNVRLRVTIPGEAIDLPVFPPGDGDASQALIETRSMMFSGKSQPGKSTSGNSWTQEIAWPARRSSSSTALPQWFCRAGRPRSISART